MPSLSDRLRSLGVTAGAQNLPEPNSRLNPDLHPIESILPGAWWRTPQGDIFYVETKYKVDFKVGSTELKPTAIPEVFGAWTHHRNITKFDISKYAFIDTETTGLAGGTGTYTFLIGVGRFEADEFRLVQLFLHDPAEEIAQLSALEEFLAPCEVLVSFNGKSFDIPLINTRYLINGWPPPFKDTAHLDLLHLARRLWKNRLPSCALGDIEYQILGLKRSEIDVPGWMVADLYFDYLHTGDARPLRGVFYHNEIDVISLSALLNHISKHIIDPMNIPLEFGSDIIAVGKLYADLGFVDKAVEIYKHGVEFGELTGEAYWEALKQYSLLNKKRGDVASSMILWEKAAQNGFIYAHEELAKVYEHVERNFQSALKWTEAAISKVSSGKSSVIDQMNWLEPLNHRRNRLLRKLNQSPDD